MFWSDANWRGDEGRLLAYEPAPETKVALSRFVATAGGAGFEVHPGLHPGHPMN
jgi:hypothetical protein